MSVDQTGDDYGRDDPRWDPLVDDLECEDCGRSFAEHVDMLRHRVRVHRAFE